ncbi:MAG: tetratricopeptide repeat-containing glycosyltransferase family 2 protein [Candidatus Loosdrechtia sp.]|uniref:tetratricopeptide repeat-containing glycosyltransferase family 2 protein n=1 Tax=Candidatus Loosdrechtia sp. TaxID=3101272 RepID=UPI003A756E9A|nr:MAG: glycosyltransferase [Candidatus Jettenia sp. AMX2]
MNTKETIPQLNCGMKKSETADFTDHTDYKKQVHGFPNSEFQIPKSKSPTLSLCMIVKDEENNLPKCLDSVVNFVDEIIIVDTGSTDRTVEIAESYGAKVFHHPWEGSFSKARNYSLKYATCDWILIMDADEEIKKEDAHKLREVIKDPAGQKTAEEAGVILIPVFSETSNGKDLSIANSERLFRNHLGIHYEGIVHNDLKYSCPTRKENIRLYHYGYNLNDQQMEKKFIRTSTLLRKQIEENPMNPVPHHYLAVSLLERKMYDECIREAQQAIRLFEQQASNSQIRLLSCYTASVAFYRKKDLLKAEEYALKSLTYYSDYLDAYCLLSSIYFLQKKDRKCIEATEKYLALLKSLKLDPGKALSIPYNTLQHAKLAYLRMSIICYEQGLMQDGLKAMKHAVNNMEEKWAPYLIVSNHFIEQDNFILAEKILIEGLKDYPSNKEILYYTADMYTKSGASDNALHYFKEIVRNHPGEMPAQYNIGLILMKCSQFEEAIRSFKSILNKEPQHIGSLFSLAVACEAIGDSAQAKDIYHIILGIQPEYPDVFIRLGSLYLNEQNYIRAKEYFLKTIQLDTYLLEAHLAMSKIYLSEEDLESCIMSCDKLLKNLNLPRNIIIDSMSDLGNLYKEIGKTLAHQQKELLAHVSFEVAFLLDPNIQSI